MNDVDWVICCKHLAAEPKNEGIGRVPRYVYRGERRDLLDVRFHECTCITVVTCVFRDGVDLKKVFIYWGRGFCRH
jgi:hypothetical protein